MKKLLLFTALILPAVAFAQTSVNFDFDYARFAHDSTSEYVEFYYSYKQDDFVLVKKDNNFCIQALLRIEIQDTLTKQFIVQKDYKIENPLQDTSRTALARNLIGVVGMIIPNGTYICKVTGSDANATKNTPKLLTELLSIKKGGDKKIALSDIQLASNIKNDNVNTKSVFYKNTLEVIPNPNMVYGEGLPVVYYYSELYNLKNDSLKNNLKLKALVYNGKKRLITSKQKYVTRNQNDLVEVNTINTSKFPTDVYTLALSVEDSISNYKALSIKKFYVFNPKVKDTVKTVVASGDMLSSEFSVLSTEECDDMFSKSKYIASGKELSQYKAIDSLNGKRKFLYDFWRRRDDDLSTPENEFKQKYFDRIRYANEKYSSMNKKGYKSDRGRVYIVYGEPDQIDRYPSSVDKKPYEVWSYNQIEGGVVFYFGDISGFSDYELLHSTKTGELQDTNWMSRIQQN
jgi:GWxTD domain-containing protein